jgi:hypothetical protein
MKVSISCTINLPGKKPRWFHNNEEIGGDNDRVTIASTYCEHTLIIHHVELDDEGEYMVVFDGVTSQTSITVIGKKPLIHNKPTNYCFDLKWQVRS